LNITPRADALTAATVVAASVVMGAPAASADTTATIHDVGDRVNLVNGAVIQGWTITDLKVSMDSIPYDVKGTLWEATATDEALQGGATPIVSNFNARARGGQTYRALFQVPTPQGVNPSSLAEGEKTSGKVYFDATGDAPDSVVYNAGGDDLLVWAQPKAPAPRSPRSAGGRFVPAQAGTGTAPALSGTEVAPVPPIASSATPPNGWQGTPLPSGRTGVPLATASPAPMPPAAGVSPTPGDTAPALAPAGSTAAPLPALGAQGEPLPAGVGSQTPTTLAAPAS
jgi:hypothetical protein